VDDQAAATSVVEGPGRSGRDDEFDSAYRRVHARLAGLARRHVGEDAAQDLLQSAVYKALVRWRAGRNIENLEAYLTTCVLSACMDLHRWSRRQRRALELLAASQQWTSEPAHEPVVRQAERDAVAVAFSQLSGDCQHILRLRILEGLSVSEVARRAVIAEGTVKSKCARCLEQLGRLIAD
jgi:RNA polymerase sigma-70 factor (ECF subfamily)